MFEGKEHFVSGLRTSKGRSHETENVWEAKKEGKKVEYPLKRKWAWHFFRASRPHTLAWTWHSLFLMLQAYRNIYKVFYNYKVLRGCFHYLDTFSFHEQVSGGGVLSTSNALVSVNTCLVLPGLCCRIRVADSPSESYSSSSHHCPRPVMKSISIPSWPIRSLMGGEAFWSNFWSNMVGTSPGLPDGPNQ
jgi:hypothetical protein